MCSAQFGSISAGSNFLVKADPFDGSYPAFSFKKSISMTHEKAVAEAASPPTPHQTQDV